MDSRNLRNSTKLSYLASVQAIAKAVKYPSNQRRLILEDIEYYRSAARGEIPTKHLKLAARPITLKDVAVAAVEFSGKARQANNSNKRHTNLQRSAVLALLSMMPLRISDVNRLTVGEHVTRDETNWYLNIGSSKTGFRHSGPLHQHLTPYLDALISRGGEKALWPEYEMRRGTPLFGTLLNEPLSSRTLAAGFKAATGHGPHIVRTLVHDALATYGDYGSVMAMVLCGQIGPATAKVYEVHAQRHRIAKAQDQLAAIQVQLFPQQKSGRTGP